MFRPRRSGCIHLLAIAAALLILLAGCGSTSNSTTTHLDSNGALEALKEGNARFVTGVVSEVDTSVKKRKSLSASQEPFAVIVGCSDSRVPPELLFDQGLGDIFVARVAGNVIDPVMLGSVEYAVDHLHSPLVVVMGHQGCGAVGAAVDGGEQPGNIGAIIALIEPSVQQAKALGLSGDAEIEKVTELNVQSGVAAVNASPVVSHLVQEGKLKVVGAEYQLVSGVVKWLPWTGGHPAPRAQQVGGTESGQQLRAHRADYVDGRFQGFNLERFVDVTLDAQFSGPVYLVRPAESGDDNDGHIGTLPQFLQHFQPVHHRHHDIKNDDVRIVFQSGLQALPAVAGGKDVVTVRLQACHDQLRNKLVVIHDQYCAHAAPANTAIYF
jgi:carbonic anhydrase